VTSPRFPLVAVYADESCLGNGREGSNPGGAGGLIELVHRGALVRRDFWLSEPATTNNRMALRSAIEALRILSARGNRLRVVFFSDSKYLVEGNREWIYGWISRGWKRRGGPVENEALWRELAERRDGHLVDWRWVRGHAGQPQNEYANLLATRAAAEQSRSNGAVPSRFDEWLSAQRAKGRMALEPFPLPEDASFRPSRPLPPVTHDSLF
jgi:ribonuclease HI